MAGRNKTGRENSSLIAADVLAVAMQTELEGVEFYKLAASRMKDPGAREMFRSLAKDEADHHRILKERYKNLFKRTSTKPPGKSARGRLIFKSPVFSKAFLASKKKKHFEMSALSVGVLLEQNSIDFYRGQQQKTKDPGDKKFFGDLAEWEGDHLRALIAQRQFLQREIFASARFEPF